jgi:hypothetical protein
MFGFYLPLLNASTSCFLLAKFITAGDGIRCFMLACVDADLLRLRFEELVTAVTTVCAYTFLHRRLHLGSLRNVDDGQNLFESRRQEFA